MIPYDSNDAAKFVENISGWVSSKGHFFGNDEHAARYDGCTHANCNSCGKPTIKSWMYCPECRQAKEIEKYYSLDGLNETQWMEYWKSKYPSKFEDVYYSETVDKYFYDFDQLWEYCDDTDLSIKSLRLKWCHPEYYRELDPDDIFGGQLPEDDEVPLQIREAFDQLNEEIRKYNSSNVASYWPSKFRVLL